MLSSNGVLSLSKLFRQAVERTPDGEAVVDPSSGVRYRYRELDKITRSTAKALRNEGLGPGDRVGICLQNRVEHVVLFLATQLIGAVAVPLNFRSSPKELAYLVNDADVDLLAYGAESAESLEGCQDELSCEAFVAVDSTVAPFGVPFESLIDAPPATDLPTVVDDEPSLVLYTSGTTGDPKGVTISHRASAMRSVMNTFPQRFRMGERMLGGMPLFHTVGLHAILGSVIALSGTYVPVRTFDPETYVELIESERITALEEAPTMYEKILDSDAIETADLDSVRVITYGGSPASDTLLSELVDTFDPEYLFNQYGCTEAFGPLDQVDLSPTDDPRLTGGTNLFQSTRIIEIGAGDPDATVDPGTEGELIIDLDSPTAFSGYRNKPEAEERAIQDGWFFTGDSARRTDEGNTVITGRVDDMIISGGENIYPVEVEEALRAHRAVADVAVVGIPDDTWNEVVKAYVVRAEDVSTDELDRWCRETDQIADFKRPRAYEFVDTIPRNDSGKVQRYKLTDE